MSRSGINILRKFFSENINKLQKLKSVKVAKIVDMFCIKDFVEKRKT